MNKYKEYFYFLDEDGLWKVKLDEENLFIVALDDSKINGKRKLIEEKNNEETCIEYIDHITKN